MKIGSILLLLAIAGSTAAHAGKKLQVLFIGNSYTSSNDLPGLVASVAASMGDTLIYDSFIGHQLQGNLFGPALMTKINTAKWDYVVLQEQSRIPAMQTNIFYGSYHFAYKTDSLVQANDPCTNLVFYMTWGYKNGDPIYCAQDPGWPAWCTYQSMDSLINLRYRTYADTLLPPQQGWPFGTILWAHGPALRPIRPSQVSPVGAVWNYIRKTSPSVELYHPDGNHPSAAGSYAGAFTFYTTLFRRDAGASSFNHVLSATEANIIRTAVKKVVYDSMGKWNIGQNDLRADFSVAATTGNTVTFANNSTLATGYIWHFGDGATSAQVQPTHSYATSGTYTVRLVALRGACSDTSFARVVTYPSGISAPLAARRFGIHPNPATNVLNITTPSHNTIIKILNIFGREVMKHICVRQGQNSIELSELPPGIYTLMLADEHGHIYHEKFLKQ